MTEPAEDDWAPEPYPSDLELGDVVGLDETAANDGDPDDEREWATERARNERMRDAAWAAERWRRA